MKILIKPHFLNAKCPCCRTVFELEEGDKVSARYGRTPTNEIYCDGLEAECPICQFDEVPINYDGYDVRLKDDTD